MTSGETLRYIANHVSSLERKLENVKFCFDVYNEYASGKGRSDAMDLPKAQAQLIESVSRLFKE